MRKTSLKSGSLFLLSARVPPLSAQEEPTLYAYSEKKEDGLYSFSLKELMNVAIVSASSQEVALC